MRRLCQIGMFRLVDWLQAPVLFYELLLNGRRTLFVCVSICYRYCVFDCSSAACFCVFVNVSVVACLSLCLCVCVFL